MRLLRERRPSVVLDVGANRGLFGEILDWLAARNFFLLAMAPVYASRATGQLLQVDGLFGVLPAGGVRQGTGGAKPSDGQHES
jgi:hypothetical protein